MAILSKIRDRSMFLILIVGLALFAFVLDPSSIQQFFSSDKVNAVGQINGDDVDRDEFAQQVEAYRSQSNGRATQMQAVNAVWNSILGEKVYQYQLEKAGIVVGEKDIWEAMIALPEIQNSPLFKNEINLFDEEKLKEYIANMKDEADAGNTQAWMNWLATEKSIKQNLERQAYSSLVTVGLGASLAEGKRDYLFDNTKMDAKFVYVPYTTIPDSISLVSKDEIQAYLKENSKRFKPEASRSLKFVKFDIVPSENDDAEIKKLVQGFINDREEYSNAAKNTVSIAGLKNATDYEAFLNDNQSDLSIDNGYKYKNQLPATIGNAIFDASVGDVVGPYKDNGYYKISKIVEALQLPDSVKSSHIIVPYAGTTRSTSTKTKEEAKKTIDSVFRLVRNNKAKFTEVADEINSDGTKGKGGDIGWVRKDQAFSAGFDKDFADFIYKNKTGSIDIVETAFGFHIIRVDEQTKNQEAVKLVTFARLIEASEETENTIFEQAETLAADLSGDKKIEDLAEESGYKIQSAMNLKAMAESIPGLSNQRQIVNWAFNSDRELNDSKRFDVDVFGKRAYVVVSLSGITQENGVVVSSDVLLNIRPELMNKKKAALIKDKMSGATLEEIAASMNTNVRRVNSVTLASPLLSGVGNEPAVVGAMSTLSLDQVSDKIDGQKGVFVVMVTKRDTSIELDNYETFRNKKVTDLKGRSFQLFQALQDAADVTDNRSKFY
ncbi:MAG: peptidylprolyl isomerase [Lutibacter sp.]|uniref:peptidylprolyl isomerase n=1 Tax=Lutibacter sp. TaxID=1925666 RepID=UPI0017E7DCB0|nr:peptidylprolyl isomerase [Lutibacter sp.]MBT8317272.1 SurA N-terminal domain-containing protein [Lutibacter sp.]NNJ58131.1 peptidylprolyl isomerase [Lutibacter sp.]